MSNVKCFDKCFGPSTRASKFLTQMPQPIICFTIKVNSICGAGRDTWNLRHKFNSQGPALRILGLRVAISKAQGPISRVLCVRVPGSWVSESRVSGSLVLGSLVSGLRSWVSGPDFTLCPFGGCFCKMMKFYKDFVNFFSHRLKYHNRNVFNLLKCTSMGIF